MDIQCSVDGCLEPVIGQCPGHNEACGRFYCRNHSRGKLCDECAAVAEQEKIYNSYCSASAYVKGGGTLKAIGIWLLWYMLFAIILIGILYVIISVSDPSIFISGFPVCLFVAALIAVFITARQISKGREKRKAEVLPSHPDFESFYCAWLANERRKAWATAGSLAVGIVVGAVAYSLSSEARIERDVNRIANRLERL